MLEAGAQISALNDDELTPADAAKVGHAMQGSHALLCDIALALLALKYL